MILGYFGKAFADRALSGGGGSAAWKKSAGHHQIPVEQMLWKSFEIRSTYKIL